MEGEQFAAARESPPGTAAPAFSVLTGRTAMFAYGLVFAAVATHMVLGLQADAPPDELHEALANEPPHWAEIHQATGMVSVQLGVSLSDAFVRLRAHAFAHGRTLRFVSREIVRRRLRLDDNV